MPRPWLSLLILALLVRAVMIGLTLAAYGIGPDPLTALGAAWDQWDAKHYLYLAANGYSHSGDARNLIAFFPLYPALISAVAAIGLPLRLAALLISVGGATGTPDRLSTSYAALADDVRPGDTILLADGTVVVR